MCLLSVYIVVVCLNLASFHSIYYKNLLHCSVLKRTHKFSLYNNHLFKIYQRLTLEQQIKHQFDWKIRPVVEKQWYTNSTVVT